VLVALGLASTLPLATAVPAGAVPAAGEDLGAVAVVASVPAAVPPVPAGLPRKTEPLADYEPQTRCDPRPKPGVVRFARLVLATYPTTRSSGIGRNCAIGGTSEHKEGRAFDWRVSAADRADRAHAHALLGWLLGKDSRGRSAAMARRLGVMYIVWNRQIWSAARADEGWRAYTGPNAHTGHIHFSFSWAGADGSTSYWSRPSPLAVAPYARTVLRPGGTGPAVVLLRRVLDEGDKPAYDAKLRPAVVRFQVEHGLVGDGVVGPRTWRVVRAELTGPPIDPADVPAGPPASSEDPPSDPPKHVSRKAAKELRQHAGTPLAAGSTGDAVKAVQRVLGVEPRSGYYGSRTAAAVRAFQRAHGLPPVGRVGPATWRELLEAYPVKKK
jgi:peptidoglycan hydrolase-like protein with peptidoglycan-binding domain